MNIYLVEHLKGIAGVDEEAVDTHEVEAESALAALEAWVPSHVKDGWLLDVNNDVATFSNPDAPNNSGRYCDYWMASEAVCPEED